jgi:hypothetical protein
MKTCKRCQQVKAREEFYAHADMADGRLSFCRDCVSERVRLHRAANDRVRAAERERYRNGAKREQAKAWSKRNAARSLVSRVTSTKVCRAIKRGELQRADRCEACGVEGYTEAAHLDYSKPLDVRWLCRRCHRRWDSRVPKTVSENVAMEAGR